VTLYGSEYYTDDFIRSSLSEFCRKPVPAAEGLLLVRRWRGPSSHGVRSYMTLILRSHVASCSEKMRINIALRGRVRYTLM
jgi:hypothetical protein